MPVFESLSRTEIYGVMWRLKSKTSNTLGLIDLRVATVPLETDDCQRPLVFIFLGQDSAENR